MWPFLIACAVGLVVLFVAEALKNKKKRQEVQECATAAQTSEKQKTYVDIPIEILANAYELELLDVTLEHHKKRSGKTYFDYITLTCGIRYRLNGKKPGKRTLAFTSYDAAGHIIETCGDHIAYTFTEAGQDVVKVCFNDCHKAMPQKITVLVREYK